MASCAVNTKDREYMAIPIAMKMICISTVSLARASFVKPRRTRTFWFPDAPKCKEQLRHAFISRGLQTAVGSEEKYALI